MNNFFTVGLTVRDCLLVPVKLLCNLCYDLAHPETWSDWEHDPWLSLGAAVVARPLLVWIGK